MSRHRFVKALNLEDELDDDAFSDEEDLDDYDMDEEQQAQMHSGIEAVWGILGPEAPVTEQEIKEALWNYYFNVEEAVSSLLDVVTKREEAEKKRKEAAQRKKAKAASSSGRSTPTTLRASVADKKTHDKPVPQTISQLQADVENMGLGQLGSSASSVASSSARASRESSVDLSESISARSALSIDDIVEEVEKRDKEGKPVLSLVVVGHVDAGKSSLMGRVLYDIGELTDRQFQQNQRQSQKIGKGSFAYAWTFDALPEERERGVTIDIAIDSFETPHRKFTLIDAPGHRDFIPNMISGAAQADAALLVIDASSGAFESGFGPNGQTREHALLVRSLGVQQVVVVVNKLDAVGWDAGRFESIVEQLRPFLTSVGFNASKLAFIPCAAMLGENVTTRRVKELEAWYSGPTLMEQLDGLNVPARALRAPTRIPVANVFKGQTTGPSGLAVTGRIETGVVQVGQRLAVLPGDQVAVVRNLEVDNERVPWAVAGQNVTAYLLNIDPIYLSTGCILCPVDEKPDLVSSFVAQIVVFDLKYPLTMGAAVELFHLSKDHPAYITKLEAVLDKSTGKVIKANPRMLSSGCSARVVVQLRSGSIPLESFETNKSMGRILLRRQGDTIAAGVVLQLLQ